MLRAYLLSVTALGAFDKLGLQQPPGKARKVRTHSWSEIKDRAMKQNLLRAYLLSVTALGAFDKLGLQQPPGKARKVRTHSWSVGAS